MLIALGPRVDPDFLDQIAGGNASTGVIDVDLVIRLLVDEAGLANRSLLSPGSRLVRRGLIQLIPFGTVTHPGWFEVRASGSLIASVLDPAVTTGTLARYCRLVAPDHTWDSVVLPDAQKDLVWRLASTDEGFDRRLDDWGFDAVMPRGRGVALLFCGPPGTGKTAFAHALAARLQRMVLCVRTSQLLASRESIQPVLSDLFGVSRTTGAIMLLDDCEGLLGERDARFLAVLEALDEHEGLLVLTTNSAPRIDFAMSRRILYRVDFEPPEPQDRHRIWELHLPPEAPLDESIDVALLANSFEFTGSQIRSSVHVALRNMEAAGEARLTMDHVRDAAETQLSARFGDLAVRSNTTLGLDSLVLPETEMAQVRDILSACRHREFILSSWGFGKRLTKGRGLCLLFDGPPGTGKTLTAELLANELKLPLYRVHLPNIVSKYIGETEKHIAEIFSRARQARAMLLFDEADSLFGRRAESASSATDRYANMEVNQLLQEVERYDGITVLTTNLYGSLDQALHRRIQFRVTFPFPEPAERARIWRVLTPPEAPLDDDVDFDKIGTRFELAGGDIKNALMRAAYRARDDGTVITHQHLMEGAVAECKAQGKLVRIPTLVKPPKGDGS